MVFHRSFSDSKYPKLFRTVLCILAVLNIAVACIVSTFLPNSKCSNPFNNPSVAEPNPPITMGIIVTFMFHCFFLVFFFNSLVKSRYLSFFSLYIRFIRWSAGTAKSPILQVFFFLLLITVRYGPLAKIRWSVCMSKSHLLLLLLLLLFTQSFSHQRKLMALHWRLSDSKSPGLFSVFWPFSIMLLFG